MSRQIHFAFLLGLATLAARSEAVAADESVTTLANRQIRYTVPESGYHTMQRGGVTATIVDNGAVDDDTLTGHRAGYSGVASLTHTNRAGNLFVPNYAGLNYEHIHDGTSQDRDILFEPRRAPMELRVVNKHTVELYQAPSPTWKLESVLRYEMLKDGTIEMTLECIPRAKTFRNGYIGLFWASYIHQPESLDIHFRGTDRDGDSNAKWIRGVTPSHGVLSTHVSKKDRRDFKHDAEFPLTLAFNNSKHFYSEPWYYAVSHKMAFIQMFRPQDQIRLTQSPSGGGKGNPAWDFQWFIPDYKVDQLYRMVMRAQYVPLESPEQIQRVSQENRTALGHPVAKDERDQAARLLKKAGVKLTLGPDGAIIGVAFPKRTPDRSTLNLLAALPELKAVSLFETNSTDETISALRPLSQLTGLDLGFCPRLTDAAVSEIARFRHLKYLNLGFARQLTNDGIARLASLEQLSILNLSVTPLTDDGLAKLSALKNLTSLDIDNTRVTDAGADHLLKLPKIRALRLVGLQLTDVGLKTISTIPTLRHINLRDVPVSDEAVAEFRKSRPGCVVKR
jgi:hypothetical protein